MAYVIELQNNPPLYLAGLNPEHHRTFCRDGALVFQLSPTPEQLEACRLVFPLAHVVEVQPEPAKVDTHGLAYIRALKHIPDPFFDDDDDLADGVEKLAKAYEESRAEIAKLREKVEILEQGNQEWVEIFDQGNQEWSDQVESLQEENAKLKDRLDAQKKTIADARDALPERWNDIPLADAFRGEIKDLKAELADIGAIIADELDLPCENTSHLEILRRRLRALMSRNVLAEQLQAENAKLKAQVAAKPEHRRISGDDLSCWRVNDFDRPGDAVFTDPGGDTHSAGKLHECATWIKNLVLAAAVELQRRDKAKPEPVAGHIHPSRGCAKWVPQKRRATCQWDDASDLMAADGAFLARVYNGGYWSISKTEMESDNDWYGRERSLSAAKATVMRIIGLDGHDTDDKPEPVADSEIRRVLEVMRYTAPKEWHDTLQAVGAELVIARESLEQVTKVKDEMRKERDALHATEGALVRDLEVAFKERDDARAEIEQCKMSLPEELRGGSVLQGIASLIRSRTYAREQASQYATRCTKAEQERDEAREKLEELERANYMAWGALPHDVKVRGGYLASRIRDLVRDLAAMTKERDAACDKLAQVQAAIAKALEL